MAGIRESKINPQNTPVISSPLEHVRCDEEPEPRRLSEGSEAGCLAEGGDGDVTPSTSREKLSQLSDTDVSVRGRTTENPEGGREDDEEQTVRAMSEEDREVDSWSDSDEEDIMRIRPCTLGARWHSSSRGI